MSDAGAGGQAVTAAELAQRVDRLSDRLWDLEDENATLRDEVADLRKQLANRDAVIERLSERIDGLDRRTDLLQLVEQADEMDGTQRSAALLQHLKRKAEARSDGEPARAAVDREQADEALHYPDVERTTIYRYMERAARLVGNRDVCWYDNGELVLDLDHPHGGRVVNAITGGEDL